MNNETSENQFLDEEFEEADEQQISTREAAKYFPAVFGTRRNGTLFVRNFCSAGLRKKHGRDSVFASFEAQDKLKNEYRKSEVSGHDARFSVGMWDGSEIVFSKLFSDWFMENSMVAIMWRAGWPISVK